MPHTSSMVRVFLLLFVGCAPATVHAQQPASAVVAREIAKARRTGHIGIAARILGQTDTAYPAATLDALADSLVTIALENSGEAERDRSLRSSARAALMESGSSRAKIPYVGAGKRLFRIAQEAPDVGARAAAIGDLTVLANASEALVLLRRIAVSDNPAAVDAVRNLWDMMPQKGGMEVLRELARSGAVTERLARRELDRVARNHGWK